MTSSSDFTIDDTPSGDSVLDRRLARALWVAKRRLEARDAAWDTEAELTRALAGLTTDSARTIDPSVPPDGVRAKHPPNFADRGLRRHERYVAVHRAWMRRVGVSLVAALGVIAVAAGVFRDRSSVATTVTDAVYQTPRGMRATVRLADGSRVTLAPGSNVRVALTTGPNATRTVTLVGEALFDVAPDPNRPFVVRTGGSVTRVLGTRFSVRRYDDEPLAHVAVASGRVVFNTVLLESGDVAQLGSDGVPIVSHGADVEALLAWSRGTLVFQNATVAEVAAQLQRWYDVTVVVAPELAGRRVNVTIDHDPRSPAQLALLGDVIGARLVRTGHVLSILVRPHSPL